MKLLQKLAILADAAKYDASCASSGSIKRDSLGSKGIGSTTSMGICHSYAPDGRCISLLKILLTNVCIYDCAYCINRLSSNVARARFSPDEVVNLTLDFYRRNYIEGLFLSSGIIRNPDYTMEQLVTVARTLRETHQFNGYIHLKTIPDAAPRLIHEAGLYADRLSINIELPTEDGLKTLAPEKDSRAIESSMLRLRSGIEESRAYRKQLTGKSRRSTLAPVSAHPTAPVVSRSRPGKPHAGRHFAPGGQSTQMIVGADGADDLTILRKSHQLYDRYGLRRVYYSAFSPIPDPSHRLPVKSPPLVREHRLYQADWLLRFYGFSVNEIAPDGQPMLDLDIDPKLAWALRHRECFPVDINRASKEQLLRVPGLGPRNVARILSSRRHNRLRLQDLARLRLSLPKIKPFIVTLDHKPQHSGMESPALKRQLMGDSAPVQGSLF